MHTVQGCTCWGLSLKISFNTACVFSKNFVLHKQWLLRCIAALISWFDWFVVVTPSIFKFMTASVRISSSGVWLELWRRESSFFVHRKLLDFQSSKLIIACTPKCGEFSSSHACKAFCSSETFSQLIYQGKISVRHLIVVSHIHLQLRWWLLWRGPEIPTS